MIKIILRTVLALGLTLLNQTPALAEETQSVTDISQCSSIQQALIIELNPQIMSALRQKYRDNFLYANVHVLPIQGSDNVEADFILEMTVMKGEWPETVQMAFRRDGLNGYKVDDINVINS
ncbi:hypothetical protein QP794_24250 [Paenibacillus sp. UMB7766-LJ446]|uniref:hypothetical protein n=1 Tax=Paenibacillus sp. UMB7766-LJ446 TaxID=3046313 RepID=UPI0025503B85|nr:hypothetical protein [Paenibacillus sp. UMB7766-LJ446]MDK8193204.1 hypothetical protein [Paenibacillus sp. UMB7766-LJ446]